VSAVDDLRPCAVLVVGDVMLDEQLWGDVRRISPEAPVPIVEVASRTVTPGGAGNTAAGVVALGGRAWLTGVVGADVNADVLRESLRAAGIDPAGVFADAGRVTTTKSRLLARGQHMLRVDSEDRMPLSAELEGAVLGYVTSQLAAADVVVLSDYGKGVLSSPLAQAIIERARHVGTPVIADPCGTDYAKYRGVAMLTPSADEVKSAVGRHLRNDAELVQAGIELAELLPGTDIVITRGAQGMWLMSDRGVALDVPADARSVYDVTGAGDTVAATVAVAVGSGVGQTDAIALANVAAGIAVGKAGTARVSLDELTAGVRDGRTSVEAR
jgi:D-glycero-beta-D-manno-heptose-7-phosphate kinase